MHGHGNAGRTPVKLVRRIQRVRRGRGRNNNDTCPPHRPNLRCDDVVGAAGNTPTQRDRLSRADTCRVRRKAGDSWSRTGGHISGSVDRSLLHDFEIGSGDRFQQV